MSETRRTFTITFDKGLDKTSLPFEANPARALDELNYVYRDGKVQKRHGVNELLNVRPTRYVAVSFDAGQSAEYALNTTEWNGIWNFTAEDGLEHLIAHIGKLLYELSEEDGYWEAKPITANTNTFVHDGETYVSCYEFENYKSTAVIGDKALYFFGGNKLMRLRYKTGSIRTFEPIEDGADTYIPTTTISITYENAIASGRQTLDQVNLMARFRKNQLLSGVGKPTDTKTVTKNFEYTLDAPLICKDEATDMAAFNIILREREME